MKQLTWKEYLKTVPEEHIYGTSLMDEEITGVIISPSDDLTGWDFSNCNLKGLSGLTSEHLRQVASMSQCVLPETVKGFAVEDFKSRISDFDSCKWPEVAIKPSDTFSGVDFSGQDISNFKGLQFEQLAQGEGWGECITPVINLNSSIPLETFTKFSLQDLDISHWIGVTAEHINAIPNVMGAKFPRMNLSTLIMENKSFYMVDFGEGFNLKWSECLKSTDLGDAKLPKMRIPMQKLRYTDYKLPETKRALEEHRRPLKSIREEMPFGQVLRESNGDQYIENTLDIHGCDFSRVCDLKEDQVKSIEAHGGVNAKVGITLQEEQAAAKRQKNVTVLLRSMSEIIAPQPPESSKIRYRIPQKLVGILSQMAWFCQKNNIDGKQMASFFKNADLKTLQEGFAEIQNNWAEAKKRGMSGKDFSAHGYAKPVDAEVEPSLNGYTL